MVHVVGAQLQRGERLSVPSDLVVENLGVCRSLSSPPWKSLMETRPSPSMSPSFIVCALPSVPSLAFASPSPPSFSSAATDGSSDAGLLRASSPHRGLITWTLSGLEIRRAFGIRSFQQILTTPSHCQQHFHHFGCDPPDARNIPSYTCTCTCVLVSTRS
jgi:hypothetical protein